MSTLNLHEQIATGDAAEILERLQEFYRKNGYEMRAEGESADSVLMMRGKSGSGWWSSNMTELASKVRLVNRGDSVEIHYDVDVSGQYLTDEDRAFWDREIQKAVEYGTGELENPPDLCAAEELRAEKGFGGRVYVGIWGAFLIAVIVLMLGFFGII